MKRFKKAKKNNKGFSLVELIVVIAIMAVLVGVLAPTLIGNIEKSRESKDLQNLDSIRQAAVTALANEAAYAAAVPASGAADKVYSGGANGGALAISGDNFTSEFNTIITGGTAMTSKQGKTGVVTLTIKSSGAVEVAVKNSTGATVTTDKVKDSSNHTIAMESK